MDDSALERWVREGATEQQRLHAFELGKKMMDPELPADVWAGYWMSYQRAVPRYVMEVTLKI
jgi:hypothetical protein